MMGVRFKKVVYPWGIGDTALLPDPAAQLVIANGEAEPYRFPDQPHAHSFGEEPPVATQSESAPEVRTLPQQTYRTKRR